MHGFVLRRFIASILTLLGASVFVFAIVRVQGDPRNLLYAELVIARSSPEAQKQWDELGRQLGLDKPIVYQYVLFLGRLLKGDMGRSLWRNNEPVSRILWKTIPATAQLALGGFIVALLGVPLGVLSAVGRGRAWDYVGRTLGLLGQSVPGFWLGIMLIIVFAVWLGWLPTSRRGGPSHFILPAITLGVYPMAGLLRLVRSSMLDVLDSEFVKFARAKGVSAFSLVWKHAFRNALIAPLTFAAILLAGLMTGSIVTETVFAWPGLGYLAISAVQGSDYPVTQGVVLLFTSFYVVAAFLLDIAYAYVDPRIRT